VQQRGDDQRLGHGQRGQRGDLRRQVLADAQRGDDQRRQRGLALLEKTVTNAVAA